ncbi:peptidase M10A and M12B matrixin and adamalysin [Halothece sp. PCC 7418]|uniref:peptidase M10A and M12B matrixin and adamalysin n=1 Tax=Halothece sp. (strain PCC 7418) TaxID=65093 RepID=UPI0002A08AF0|nr:peptidase M10A and M12B matrixin and adamalysin [Halothece sp. PCC 7418]AFZ44157.1 peptidase M10A and M12B matrixin and adamalysin [Halothece sp. PCC 7418]
MSSNSSFNIEFDFRFDTNGFFDDPVRRDALESAGDIWESFIEDDFPDVPAGIEFTITNPENGSDSPLIKLQDPIDDLLIFVGAQSPPFGMSGSAIARGGFTGGDASGDIFRARITNNFRGTGPVTNFEPWAGEMSFEPSPTFNDGSDVEWFFDSTPETSDDIPNGSIDFITVALHEIGHVLGIGTAPIFEEIGAGSLFDGVNSLSVNNGSPIPLTTDLSHVQEGFFNNEVLMDPIAPFTRNLPSQIDLALLSDIGYEIEGFNPQGESPAIATETGETIFGTIVSDTLNGLGGDDQLQGNLGNDVLNGGSGNDSLFGEEGIDTFAFGENNGEDRINDFDVATEIIQISSSLGFATADEVFATLSKPFTNVSQFTLSPGNTIEVFHESTPQDTPLTADNFEIVASEETFLAIAPLDAIKQEGNSDFTAFTFEVTRSGNTSSETKVEFAVEPPILPDVVDGQMGVNPDDFAGNEFPSGSVTFAPQENNKTITIQVAGDTTPEIESENFQNRDLFNVTLSNPSDKATIEVATATGEILNDDKGGLNDSGEITPNTTTILQENSPNVVPVSTGFFIDFAGAQDRTRTFDIAIGAGAHNLDSGATVNLSGTSSEFDYQRDGSTLEIFDREGNLTAELLASIQRTSPVNFEDGSTEVAVAGGQITFGGQSFDDGEFLDGATQPLTLDQNAESLEGLNIDLS